MKKILKFSIAPFLFALICNLSASAASTPGGNPSVDKGKKATTTNGASHKQTAAKENKKFTTVFYQYGGAQPTTSTSLTDAANWTLVGSNPCSNPPLTGLLCSIEFDPALPVPGGTTLAQALALLPVLTTYPEGTIYSGGGHSVKVHVKTS